jgi:hypothetical protein
LCDLLDWKDNGLVSFEESAAILGWRDLAVAASLKS